MHTETPKGQLAGTEIYLRTDDVAAYYADPDGNVIVVARPA